MGIIAIYINYPVPVVNHPVGQLSGTGCQSSGRSIIRSVNHPVPVINYPVPVGQYTAGYHHTAGYRDIVALNIRPA
jgi:hypothetical protein